MKRYIRSNESSSSYKFRNHENWEETYDVIPIGRFGEYESTHNTLEVDLPRKLNDYLVGHHIDVYEILDFLEGYTNLDKYSFELDSFWGAIGIYPVNDEQEAKMLTKFIRSCLMDLQSDL